MAFPLAGMQLIPTARLARLASNQRDFNYLSLCATTPLHLVNYVAPGLFHRSPLWRPLVWTPFHTSPEEQLAYVGLVPLFLAVMVTIREARGDPAVRVLAFLGVTSALLSLGPFVPGFHELIGLPGFSFFRAPARWGVATSLALAVLAGKGLDRLRTWPTPGRFLIGLAILSVLWIGLVLGGVELALGAGSGSSHPGFSGLFQKAFQARPWADDPDFLSVQAQARRPATDSRVPAELKRAGVARKTADPRSFVERRYEIYRAELGETASLLAAIVVLALIGATRKGRSALPAGLVLLSFLDLMLLGRHKLTEVGPLRPLVEQSPVLARLASLPRTTRSVDGFRNLSMLAGVAPISAYRTLDLPALEPLTVDDSRSPRLPGTGRTGSQGDARRRRRGPRARPRRGCHGTGRLSERSVEAGTGGDRRPGAGRLVIRIVLGYRTGGVVIAFSHHRTGIGAASGLVRALDRRGPARNA